MSDAKATQSATSNWDRTAKRARQLYGISSADYVALKREQRGHCANENCFREATVVDHNHETGEVRGLLCQQCNSAAGLLQDHPEVIMGLADYLQRVGHYG